MAEANCLKVVNDLLNEEKWTRAALNSYTINNFRELDEIIEDAVAEKCQQELKQLCDEHLAHTKNSIIALYLSGIISLNKQLVDDSNLLTIINIFTDNHKWNIVEYLCNRILEFGENKMALRTLSDCFENEGKTDEKFAIWERLIRVDYEEAEIARLLAEKREEEGDIEKAIDFYKKALHRFVNKKQSQNVKEVWAKLIDFCPEETDFFFHADKKIAKVLNEDKAAQLLEALYNYFKTNEHWDKAIEILKRILGYDPKSEWARKEITLCYREKYAEHSHLDEYIKVSNLSQSFRNVYDAIIDFEKHISFDTGNFVCHRTWGIGRIASIKDDQIIIDFSRKRNHQMSLKMAVNALQGLKHDHIWVLRTMLEKDVLKKKIKTDIPWALKIVIRSFENAATMKKIKAELVPAILTQGEWSSWSTQARSILKTDPMFGNLPDKADSFVVREKPISLEEKTFNQFQAEKSYFARVKCLQDYLALSDPESDYFAEMLGYFNTFLKAYSTVNEQVISSYLLISMIIKKFPFLNPGINTTFENLYSQIGDVEETFQGIEDSSLQKEFLIQVRSLPNWQLIYIRIFPHHMSSEIIRELSVESEREHLNQLINDMIDHYREYREAFIWLVKNLDPEYFEAVGFTYEKILIHMIHLMEITFRGISNRQDVSLNRKLNKQVHNYLIKENRIEEFFKSVGEESVSRIFSLLEDIKDLDPALTLELRHKIIERFPGFKFFTTIEKEVVSRGLLVTADAYKRKNEELKHILEVEVPANSKDIGAAIEKGDLRENAEYKAAKERQEMLNSTVARMKEEIEKAQIFDVKTINAEKISFGTKAFLKNLNSKAEEEFAILGPWESDPKKNVISYLSPIAGKLLNHVKDDEVAFTINDTEYRYKVLAIEACDL